MKVLDEQRARPAHYFDDVTLVRIEPLIATLNATEEEDEDTGWQALAVTQKWQAALIKRQLGCSGSATRPRTALGAATTTAFFFTLHLYQRLQWFHKKNFSMCGCP